MGGKPSANRTAGCIPTIMFIFVSLSTLANQLLRAGATEGSFLCPLRAVEISN